MPRHRDWGILTNYIWWIVMYVDNLWRIYCIIYIYTVYIYIFIYLNNGMKYICYTYLFVGMEWSQPLVYYLSQLRCGAKLTTRSDLTYVYHVQRATARNHFCDGPQSGPCSDRLANHFFFALDGRQRLDVKTYIQSIHWNDTSLQSSGFSCQPDGRAARCEWSSVESISGPNAGGRSPNISPTTQCVH